MKLKVIGFVAVVLSLALALPVQAEPPLKEVEGAAFSLAIHNKMNAVIEGRDSAEALQAASALPRDVSNIQVVKLSWPKAKTGPALIIADRGIAASPTDDGADHGTTLAVVLDDKVHKLAVPADLAKGIISRLCVWPTSVGSDADLIFVSSFYSFQSNDCGLFGFRVPQSGIPQVIDLGNAKSLFAWFELTDIDNNGSYELITSRSLDGVPGGLFYHAVREYDASANAYGAAPQVFREYYLEELAWLDWVVLTRAQIQAAPEQYIRTGNEGGYVFVGQYGETVYGFDSVVEVKPGFLGMEDVTEYNEQRRAAFTLVKDYRDQLKAWLDGGAFPVAWQL